MQKALGINPRAFLWPVIMPNALYWRLWTLGCAKFVIRRYARRSRVLGFF